MPVPGRESCLRSFTHHWQENPSTRRQSIKESTMKKNPMLTLILTLAVLTTAAALARSQDAGSPPAPQSQPQSAQQCHKHSIDMQGDMLGRGEEGMEFSQTKTTHH